MIISEVIQMLSDEIQKHGDIEVYVDMDYGQREVVRDKDPLCRSPLYECATTNLPERIVI